MLTTRMDFAPVGGNSTSVCRRAECLLRAILSGWSKYLSTDFPRHSTAAPPVDQALEMFCLPEKTPAPVLAFLHGFGVNFKAYIWLLSMKDSTSKSSAVVMAMKSPAS